MHEITLIPGDGTGPELCEFAVRCLRASGADLQFDVHSETTEAGQLSPALVSSLKRTRFALKGPTSTPAGSKSLNTLLRQQLGLFASMRFCRSFDGVARWNKSPVDVLVMRETTEDLYVGIELPANHQDTRAIIELINHKAERQLKLESAIAVKAISPSSSQRFFDLVFATARRLGRRRITIVHKANLLKATDGLFLSVGKQVAESYPDIACDDIVVDNLCMQLVQGPTNFDVLALPNLYGDIVGDLLTGIIGGLSITPSANLNHELSFFEPTHGSAMKYRGQNKVNPTAMVLSGSLLLRFLGEKTRADRIDAAVASVLEEGKFVTYDLKPTRHDASAVGSKEMIETIISRLASN